MEERLFDHNILYLTCTRGDEPVRFPRYGDNITIRISNRYIETENIEFNSIFKDELSVTWLVLEIFASVTYIEESGGYPAPRTSPMLVPRTEATFAHGILSEIFEQCLVEKPKELEPIGYEEITPDCFNSIKKLDKVLKEIETPFDFETVSGPSSDDMDHGSEF